MRLLFFGDIVGKPGRRGIAELLPVWRQRYAPDAILANGENAAHGLGITPNIAQELFDLGIEALTLGNHTWHHKEIIPYIDQEPRLIRPANYAPGCPGAGYRILNVLDKKLAVISLIGRVFMDSADCPFRAFDRLENEIEADVLFVDFHGEATSEKMAFALYADGRASAVIGTHTHVQTADEQILPGGTAFLTDVGMCGPWRSVIGMEGAVIVNRFLTGMPAKFEVPDSNPVVSAVLIDFDRTNGKALAIQRLQHRPDPSAL